LRARRLIPEPIARVAVQVWQAGADRDFNPGEQVMSNNLLKLYVIFQGLKNSEEGQDLVEYALLVALISLACIAAVQGVASAVNTVFVNISTSLS
jgi:pilus assembly protein Flp/PilA